MIHDHDYHVFLDENASAPRHHDLDHDHDDEDDDHDDQDDDHGAALSLLADGISQL